MFIVRWEGGRPGDKAEWIAVLREALSGRAGLLPRLLLSGPRRGGASPSTTGPREPPEDEAVIANSPESVAFNIQQLLSDGGKPLDPDWSPLSPTQLRVFFERRTTLPPARGKTKERWSVKHLM